MPVMSHPPQILEISTNTICLEWVPWDPHKDDGDPPITGYIIYVNFHQAGGWSKRVDPAVNSTILKNLQANTSYEIWVAAVREGEGGFGPPSPPILATTLPLGENFSLKTL